MSRILWREERKRRKRRSKLAGNIQRYGNLIVNLFYNALRYVNN